MSVDLDALILRLEQSVPPRNGQPADYQQIVQDAVAQFGADVPEMRNVTLPIVAGTADYDLPADFSFLVELEPVWADRAGASVHPITGKLYAWGAGDERVWVEGTTLRLSPTPTYTMGRTLRYAASYALTNATYERLTENGARVALLYAQYLATMAQAGQASQSAWRYQIGDEVIDKSRLGDAVRGAAEGYYKQYLAAVQRLKGYGMRALSPAGSAAWV